MHCNEEINVWYDKMYNKHMGVTPVQLQITVMVYTSGKFIAESYLKRCSWYSELNVGIMYRKNIANERIKTMKSQHQLSHSNN